MDGSRPQNAQSYYAPNSPCPAGTQKVFHLKKFDPRSPSPTWALASRQELFWSPSEMKTFVSTAQREMKRKDQDRDYKVVNDESMRGQKTEQINQLAKDLYLSFPDASCRWHAVFIQVERYGKGTSSFSVLMEKKLVYPTEELPLAFPPMFALDSFIDITPQNIRFETDKYQRQVAQNAQSQASAGPQGSSGYSNPSAWSDHATTGSHQSQQQQNPPQQSYAAPQQQQYQQQAPPPPRSVPVATPQQDRQEYVHLSGATHGDAWPGSRSTSSTRSASTGATAWTLPTEYFGSDHEYHDSHHQRSNSNNSKKPKDYHKGQGHHTYHTREHVRKNPTDYHRPHSRAEDDGEPCVEMASSSKHDRRPGHGSARTSYHDRHHHHHHHHRHSSPFLSEDISPRARAAAAAAKRFSGSGSWTSDSEDDFYTSDGSNYDFSSLDNHASSEKIYNRHRRHPSSTDYTSASASGRRRATTPPIVIQEHHVHHHHTPSTPTSPTTNTTTTASSSQQHQQHQQQQDIPSSHTSRDRAYRAGRKTGFDQGAQAMRDAIIAEEEESELQRDRMRTEARRMAREENSRRERIERRERMERERERMEREMERERSERERRDVDDDGIRVRGS